MKKYYKKTKITILTILSIISIVTALNIQDYTIHNNINSKIIQGKITKVYDGDTLTILHNNNKVKIRLYGIDAPELQQEFGIESQNNLENLCQIGNQALIEVKNKDKYNRIVGVVSCNNQNANKEQVKNGYAWAYTEYIPNQKEKIEYSILQKEAMIHKIGLWQKDNPIEPKIYRKEQK